MPAAGQDSLAFHRHVLVDAAIAAGLAALLALPLLGFRLSDSAQGGALEYRFLWVLYAAAAVFLGRLTLGYSRRLIPQTRAIQSAIGLFSRAGALPKTATAKRVAALGE